MRKRDQIPIIDNNQTGRKNLWGYGILLTLFLVFSLTACSPGQPAKIPTGTPPSIITRVPTKTVISATSTIQATKTLAPQPTKTAFPTLTFTPDYFTKQIPLSNNAYVIPLTVRHVTESSATFFFELQNHTPGLLIYRNSNSSIQKEIPFSAEKTRQIIKVDGLAAGTEYEAQVLLGGEADGFEHPPFSGKGWGTIQFHTSSDQWPLRVGVLGDASFGDEATEALVNLIAAQNLNFVIHTGDVVYETDSSDIFNSYLQKFFEPFSPLLHQGPIYTVLGNHDYDLAVRWDDAPFYDYAFPPFPNPAFSYPENRRGNQYYAHSFQDIQFIFVDTHVFAGSEGRAEQDAWIDERLADPRFRVTIPVFHVAPYSSSVVHPDDGRPVRLSWNWRFEEANVPLVLSGHFHHYERLIANNISYIVSGGGSSTLYAQGEQLPESQIYARKTHFVLLEFYEDYIDLSAISLAGEILDQAFIPLK